MPPKTAKQKEEEAQKLLEEQRKREEEERIRQEELKKYQILTLPTGLQMPLTKYYVEEAMKVENCDKFTQEFIKKVLENGEILQNFQLIDLQNLRDQIVYDLVYAKFELGLNDLKTQILLNIFYEVYSYQNPKFTQKPKEVKQNEVNEKSEKKQRKQTKMIIVKSKEQDWKLLKELLEKHSQYAENSQKYFTSKQLDQIINYSRKTYFSHHQLIQFTSKNVQRPVDIILQFGIDRPSEMPILDKGEYFPHEKDDFDQKHQELMEQHQNQNQQEEEYREPTDEELLDPHVLKIIEEKLKNTKENLEQKLESRQEELNIKLQDYEKPVKKGKK